MPEDDPIVYDDPTESYAEKDADDQALTPPPRAFPAVHRSPLSPGQKSPPRPPPSSLTPVPNARSRSPIQRPRDYRREDQEQLVLTNAIC